MRPTTGVEPRPATGRREIRKQVTRRELLTAGRRLFSEKGLYDSRIEDLTQRAGIAKGTLYGYFADKVELVEAVVTSGFDELGGLVQRNASGAATRDARVVAVTRAHLGFFDDNPDLLRVFHQVRGLLKFDLPRWRGLRRVLEHHLEAVAQLISRDGTTADERARAAAKVLFGSVSGIASVRVSTRAQEPALADTDATARAVAAAVITFLDARGPARAHPR